MRRLAFNLGRTIGTHPLASRLFCLVEPMLPLERLGRSARCVAFNHPRPGYDPHILVVPTTPFPALVTKTLAIPLKSELLWEMIELAHDVILHQTGQWQMIVNGGTRQEIGQVHGHLVHTREQPPSGARLELTNPASEAATWTSLFEGLDAASHHPGTGFSVVFQVSNQRPATAWITESNPA